MLHRALERGVVLFTLVAFFTALLVPAIAVQLAIVGIPAPLPAPVPSPVSAALPLPSPSPVPSAAPTPMPILRVGIQSGHLQACDVPDELSALRCAWGVSGNGWDEVVVNHQVALQVAGMLRPEGIEVDILPTTVPEEYRANLFVALHSDGYDGDRSLRGFKVARAEWSRQPAVDDALVRDLVTDYQTATGLPESRGTNTDNMTQYYAFDYAKYLHAISPSTPAAIIEMGLLTNDDDRELLTQHQERAARGIAKAVLDFLGRPSRTGL